MVPLVFPRRLLLAVLHRLAEDFLRIESERWILAETAMRPLARVTHAVLRQWWKGDLGFFCAAQALDIAVNLLDVEVRVFRSDQVLVGEFERALLVQ